jgi:hypothetical protein
MTVLNGISLSNSRNIIASKIARQNSHLSIYFRLLGGTLSNLVFNGDQFFVSELGY